MNGQHRPVVRWVLLAQMLLATGAAVVAVPIGGWTSSVFVLLGGMAAVALTSIFALRAFTVDAAVDAQRAFGAMVRAEATRLVAAVIFFIVVAKVIPEHFGPVIIGFCVATLSYFLALRFAGGGSLKAPADDGGPDRD